MGIQAISLVKWDQRLEYVPVASSITNLVDLFLKTAVLLFKNPATITGNPFYTHLKDKSFTRCTVLLVPVLGNVAVWLYDLSQRKDTSSYILRMMAIRPDYIAEASERLKGDKTFLLQAIKVNPDATMKHCSVQLIDDPDFMLEAIGVSEDAFRYLSDRLRGDNNFLNQAVLKNNSVLKYIQLYTYLLNLVIVNGSLLEKLSLDYKESTSFVSSAIAKNPPCLKHSPLRDNQRFMWEKLAKDGLLLQYAGEEIQKSHLFVKLAMNNNIAALQFSPLKNDRGFVREAIQEHGGAVFQYADENLRGDRQFALESLGKNEKDDWTPTAWPFIDARLRCNPDFTKHALISNGWVLKKLSEGSRNVVDFVDCACTHFPDAIVHAGAEVMKTRTFVLDQVKKGNALALKCAPDFQADLEVVETALDADDMALEYVAEDLANDIAIVRRAIASNPTKSKFLECPAAAKFIGKNLLANEAVMIALINDHPAIIKHLPTYQNNRKAVLALLTVYPMQLEHVHASLRSDKEVVLIAVKKYGMALEFAHEDLKKDWDVVLAAQAQHSLAITVADPQLHEEWKQALGKIEKDRSELKNIHEKLRTSKVFLLHVAKIPYPTLEYMDEAARNDKDIVALACDRHYESFRHMGETLKKDELFLLELLRGEWQKGFKYLHYPEELRNKKEFALKAVQTNAYAFNCLINEHQHDIDVMIAAAAQNPKISGHFPFRLLLKDKEIVRVLLKANKDIYAHLDERVRDDAEVKQIAQEEGALPQSA